MFGNKNGFFLSEIKKKNKFFVILNQKTYLSFITKQNIELATNINVKLDPTNNIITSL